MSVWQEIVDYTVPSNTTSVVLDNFGTITKDDFIKVVTTHYALNETAFLTIFPNNQTSESNYHVQILNAIGSGVSSVRLNAAYLGDTFLNTISMYETIIKISENNIYNAFTNGNHRNDSDSRVQFYYTTSSGVSFSGGINSLTFTTNRTNGIGAGSRIQIYRLNAEKVADITVSSNTTQVDITGLDIGKGSEYLLVSDSLPNPTSSRDILLFVNNDTITTNYYSQVIYGTGTAAVAIRLNTALLVGGGTGLSSISYSYLKLSNTGSYTGQHYEIRNYGTSNILIDNAFVSSTAENITSINQLNIKSTLTNGIASGSRFTLYKLY